MRKHKLLSIALKVFAILVVCVIGASVSSCALMPSGGVNGIPSGVITIGVLAFFAWMLMNKRKH